MAQGERTMVWARVTPIKMERGILIVSDIHLSAAQHRVKHQAFTLSCDPPGSPVRSVLLLSPGEKTPGKDQRS